MRKMILLLLLPFGYVLLLNVGFANHCPPPPDVTQAIQCGLRTIDGFTIPQVKPGTNIVKEFIKADMFDFASGRAVFCIYGIGNDTVALELKGPFRTDNPRFWKATMFDKYCGPYLTGGFLLDCTWRIEK